jgi:hypothetical protein
MGDVDDEWFTVEPVLTSLLKQASRLEDMRTEICIPLK